MSIVIRNGHIIDPAQNIDAQGWVHIIDDSIAGMGTGDPPAGITADENIDATKCYVTPGFIDMHVHLREPGEESKETIETGSRAAVAGGFTSIACMPNTHPAIDTASTVKFIYLEAQRVGLANVLPVGTVTRERKGKELADIGDLVSAGIVGISDDGSPVENPSLMMRALEYAKMFSIPVINHCEDLRFTNDGVMNEGFYSTKLGLRGIPSACEDVMIARDIILAEYTGGCVHIAHLSTAQGTALIRDAKKRGVNVTCEVTPHHLTLTDAALCDYDTRFKMSPPLRSEEDRAALIEGLKDGTIDAIATDHAPHTNTDKDVEFDYAANGVIGLETALPVLFEKLCLSHTLPLPRLIELLSTTPARILRLEKKGSLIPGADADITIWRSDEEYILDAHSFYSKARNTPFDGWPVHARVLHTLCNGRIVYPFPEK